jgi:hypothetical protein
VTTVLEKVIKAAVHKRLREIGAYQHWPVQLGMGDRCLDCHGCYQGAYFAVETKRPGAKPTKIQWVTIENIQAAGGLVFVIDSLEAASALFSDHPPPLAKAPSAIRSRLRVVAGRSDD